MAPGDDPDHAFEDDAFEDDVDDAAPDDRLDAGAGAERVVAVAPGRVNLIGDHTDHQGGLALPMAVQFATTVTGLRAGGGIELTSDQLEGRVAITLPVAWPEEAARTGGAFDGIVPAWGRLVGGVAAAIEARRGFVGHVTSTVPLGSGLSSSAAFEVAVALALGAGGSPLEVARDCQRAEQVATGVPCGIMDQLTATAGVEGHALLMDFATDEVTPVAVPDGARFWVVDSGQRRRLETSAYAARRAQCEAAVELVGPLPRAEEADIEAIADPVLRARARHVRTECDRVRAFAAALAADDLVRAGEHMVASHRSLRDDFEVSTPALDALVDRLVATPGVLGARLTGAGFGGCVVALAGPGVRLDGWEVRPAAGAHVEVSPG